jgi:simple sugar transport system permease protein
MRFTTQKTDRRVPSQREATIAPAQDSGGAPAWRSLLKSVIARPETSAFAGVLAVFAYFAVTAGHAGFLTRLGTETYLEVTAEIGIIAIPVTLLMIAGEFDLSVGSMTSASGMVFTYCVLYAHWPFWASLITSLAAAAAAGAMTGWLIVKTGLPSFIVTLGTLYALAGLAVAVTRDLTNNTVFGGISEAVHGQFLAFLFSGSVLGLPMVVVWWLVLGLLAAIVLTKTRFGNWIYATGGAKDSALKSGVPVSRVKIILFSLTALSAALVAVLTTIVTDSSNVSMGQDFEFQAITIAVIGGTLVTGGYGSVIGAMFGALIYGMVSQGFFFTNIVTDWFQVFLGVMLVSAVAVNHYVRIASLRRKG